VTATIRKCCEYVAAAAANKRTPAYHLGEEASPSRKQSHRRTTDDTEARVCVMNVSHVTM